jgi:hypothetical protein
MMSHKTAPQSSAVARKVGHDATQGMLQKIFASWFSHHQRMADVGLSTHGL